MFDIRTGGPASPGSLVYINQRSPSGCGLGTLRGLAHTPLVLLVVADLFNIDRYQLGMFLRGSGDFYLQDAILKSCFDLTGLNVLMKGK